MIVLIRGLVLTESAAWIQAKLARGKDIVQVCDDLGPKIRRQLLISPKEPPALLMTIAQIPTLVFMESVRLIQILNQPRLNSRHGGYYR